MTFVLVEDVFTLFWLGRDFYSPEVFARWPENSGVKLCCAFAWMFSVPWDVFRLNLKSRPCHVRWWTSVKWPYLQKCKLALLPHFNWIIWNPFSIMIVHRELLYSGFFKHRSQGQARSVPSPLWNYQKLECLYFISSVSDHLKHVSVMGSWPIPEV